MTSRSNPVELPRGRRRYVFREHFLTHSRNSPVSVSFAPHRPPPYYAVLFTSQRTAGEAGYDAMAERMTQLAAQQPGFLGIESVRGADGFGITLSYWESPEAIRSWKDNAEHIAAQEGGRREWYQHYELRVARVERAYAGPESALHPAAWATPDGGA